MNPWLFSLALAVGGAALVLLLLGLIQRVIRAEVISKAKKAGGNQVREVDAAKLKQEEAARQIVMRPQLFTPETLFPWGRYRGQQLQEVPSAVLRWTIEVDDDGVFRHTVSDPETMNIWAAGIIEHLKWREAKKAAARQAGADADGVAVDDEAAERAAIEALDALDGVDDGDTSQGGVDGDDDGGR